MVVVYAFLIVVEVVSALLLIGVIFLQKSSGAGMGTAFGGVGEAIFGSRMGNFLTKATVVLAVVFLANTTLLASLGSRRHLTSVVDRLPMEEPALPVTRPLDPGRDEGLLSTSADPDDAMWLDLSDGIEPDEIGHDEGEDSLPAVLSADDAGDERVDLPEPIADPGTAPAPEDLPGLSDHVDQDTIE